jgi:hypothetical protein
MQLRVARLCLDCEELHVDNSCPHCASQHYAFLSAWLPSEERRRWARSGTRRTSSAESWSWTGASGLVHSVVQWLSWRKPEQVQIGPATRASDYAAHLNFDRVNEEKTGTRAHLDVHLSKHDAR